MVSVRGLASRGRAGVRPCTPRHHTEAVGSRPGRHARVTCHKGISYHHRVSTWRDLDPDPRLTEALDQADRYRGSRSALITNGSSSAKNNWSNTFADACARMVAGPMRAHQFSRRLTVLPDPDGSAEPPTITYWERGEQKTKKVDILVGDLIAGLRVAISLKGVAFRDQASLGFGKNITGRQYERENETRRLHEYRPRAIVVALYFVPLGAVGDKKTERNPSGFADVVTSVRQLTGRSDLHRQNQWHRVDLGFVGLYVPGDPEDFEIRDKSPGRRTRFQYSDPLPRGVIRYFDVQKDAPQRGRPAIEDVYTLEEMVEIIAAAQVGPAARELVWAEPEPD